MQLYFFKYLHLLDFWRKKPTKIISNVFQALCEEFEQECCSSLAQSIQRHLVEAEKSKVVGNENWWKAHEATMLALGSVHEVIEKQIEDGNVDFDIKGFLENVVLNDAAKNGKFAIHMYFNSTKDLKFYHFTLRLRQLYGSS